MASNVGVRLLKLLAAKRDEHAVASLISPKHRSSFEYGRVSGFFQGLQVAEELLLQIVAEEERTKHERSI